MDINDMLDLCEEITTICNKVDCADRGHVITWSGSTTLVTSPPTGDYVCLECGELVVVEKG